MTRIRRGYALAVLAGAVISWLMLSTSFAANSVNSSCDPGLNPNTSNATQTSLQVNWTDNCVDESGFFVDWNTSGPFGGDSTRPTDVAGVSGSASNLAGATSKVVTGLACETTYYFRVVAYKVAGTNTFYAPSGVVSGTTLDCDETPPPPPPTGSCGPAAPAIANQILRLDYGFKGNDPKRGEIINLIGMQTGTDRYFAANTRCEDYVAYVQSVYAWLVSVAGLPPLP